MITQEKVLELFEYRDGELYWKKDVAKNVKKGFLAGVPNPRNYKIIGINGKTYRAHRLIFLMFYGYLPKIIDHIDGNTLNNKINNLREAKSADNSANSKLSKNNTTGAKGVFWKKRIKKWEVAVSYNKQRHHFGVYKDFELAELVAIEARNKYHGEFAKHF